MFPKQTIKIFMKCKVLVFYKRNGFVREGLYLSLKKAWCFDGSMV